MLLPVLFLSLAAVEPAPVVKVLVTDTAGDLDSSARTSINDMIVRRLKRFASLEVTVKREREKQLDDEHKALLEGCAGDCPDQHAAAFAVDVVAVSQAGKVAGSTVFTLELFDSKGESVARGNAQVSGLDDRDEKIASVIDEVGRSFTHQEPGDQPSSSSSAATPVAAVELPPLRMPLLIGGGVGVGVGVVTALLGTIPALAASGAENDLKVLRTRYVDAGRDDALLDDAATKQQDAENARGQWNDGGIYAFWGGFVVAVAGGGALAASFLLEDAP
jgi:hypothetical protein